VSPGAATLDRPARTGGCYLDGGVYFATDGVSPSCFKESRTFIRSSSIRPVSDTLRTRNKRSLVSAMVLIDAELLPSYASSSVVTATSRA
jgi:hypothetical protein